ncbi:FliH/SctL family protein [Niveispirillum cyanobacteriorum]|nr:FliH/SctL family protein [Niveispirillum cyanobacteriorum]GGE60187.1 flagellar assembly protein FliH [Niveispirillum cyanobacteriorum]
MATIQKFLFEKDFEDGFGGAAKAVAPPPEPEPELPPAPPPPPPPPTFSVEQLQQQVKMAKDQARTAALAEGIQQGRQQAEVEAQQELSNALRSVENCLKQLVTVQNAQAQMRQENTARIALAIMRKLWPGLVERQGLAEIEVVIAAFMEELVEEPKLVFRVNERWFDELRGRIDDMALRHGFAGQVTVLADPKLSQMDVKVDWAAGGAEREVGRLWTEIERIAGDVLADFPGGPKDAILSPKREVTL